MTRVEDETHLPPASFKLIKLEFQNEGFVLPAWNLKERESTIPAGWTVDAEIVSIEKSVSEVELRGEEIAETEINTD